MSYERYFTNRLVHLSEMHELKVGLMAQLKGLRELTLELHHDAHGLSRAVRENNAEGRKFHRALKHTLEVRRLQQIGMPSPP